MFIVVLILLYKVQDTFYPYIYRSNKYIICYKLFSILKKSDKSA